MLGEEKDKNLSESESGGRTFSQGIAGKNSAGNDGLMMGDPIPYHGLCSYA